MRPYQILAKYRIQLALGALFILFLVLRLPGLSLPYHQDEGKAALLSSYDAEALSHFHHPPLTLTLFRIQDVIFGPDNFRMFILLFSVLGFSMMMLVLRKRFGWDATLLSLLFLSAGAYAVLSSLMVDTDGAILPFFFLLSLYLYDRAYEEVASRRRVFIALLFSSLMVGLLIKLSFIIVIGTIIFDFLYRERARFDKKRLITFSIYLLAVPLVFALVVGLTKAIYPLFNIEKMITHVGTYINFTERGWMQIIVQAAKAIFYLSPALIVLPFLAPKEAFERTRIFFFYLALGFVFYFVLFDFSEGALDKYLMFSIIPLSAISGATLASIWERRAETKASLGLAFGIIGSIILFVLLFLPHDLLPLYPKSLWASNVFHLKWDILIPFTGGSGPLGFYMSFLFMGASFFISLLIGLVAFFKKEWKYSAAIILLMVGLTYNFVFINELLRGTLYGSAPKVLKESLVFIKNSPDIKSVITSNDAGAYDLHKMGKYSGRFYAVPGYEESHKERFAAHDGHYLVLDMPRLNENSFYTEFFSKCESIFSAQSGTITSNVYSCPLTK